MTNYNLNTKNFWFAARTIANIELKMKDYFQKHQIECFIPSTIKLIKKKGEIKEEESPVIKNLIFFKTSFALVNSVFNLNHRKIYRIRNKAGLITIPEVKMDEFISFVSSYSGKVEFISDSIIGDRMMIKAGPLAGMQGIITKIDGKNFFTIYLEGLLSVGARIAKKDLVRVSDKNKSEPK